MKEQQFNGIHTNFIRWHQCEWHWIVASLTPFKFKATADSVERSKVRQQVLVMTTNPDQSLDTKMPLAKHFLPSRKQSNLLYPNNTATQPCPSRGCSPLLWPPPSLLAISAPPKSMARHNHIDTKHTYFILPSLALKNQNARLLCLIFLIAVLPLIARYILQHRLRATYDSTIAKIFFLLPMNPKRPMRARPEQLTDPTNPFLLPTNPCDHCDIGFEPTWTIYGAFWTFSVSTNSLFTQSFISEKSGKWCRICMLFYVPLLYVHFTDGPVQKKSVITRLLRQNNRW